MAANPVRIVGIVTAVVIAILQALSTEGVISSDITVNLINLITILAPILAAEIARRFVTPISSPSLPAGTKVEVVTSEGQPNFTTTL
jgi:hypothetical protein